MTRWTLLLGLATTAAQAEGLRDIRGAVVLVPQTPFVYSGAVLVLFLGFWLWRRRPPARPVASLPGADRLAALAAEYRRGERSGLETLLRLDGLLRARLDALTLTTPELLARSAAPTSLGSLLARLDQVKFAAHAPDAEEVEQALVDAAIWLDATEQPA
jgi:hypothetical protein